MGKANRKKNLSKKKQTSGISVSQKSFISNPFFIIPLISILVLIAYSNIFSYPFYFDDIRTIRDNPALRDLSNYLPFGTWGNRYLGDLSFALNFHYGYLDVFGYHMVNVVIHILNGILVWFLVGQLFETPVVKSSYDGVKYKAGIMLMVALFFALHPVQTQAVTYTVQRYASLATLFYILAIIMYLKARLSEVTNKQIVYTIASFLAAFLAMKTKEISFTIPFMIILIEWVFFLKSGDGLKNLLTTKRLYSLLPMVLTVFIIPLSMLSSGSAGMGDLLSSVEKLTAETESITRGNYLLTQFSVVAVYLKLLVLPFGQVLDYDFKIDTSFFKPLVMLAFLLHVSILAGSFWILNKSKSNGKALGVLGVFGVFWFYGALSVESSIIPIRDIIFEHRMYLPMVGGSLAVICGLLYGWEKLSVSFAINTDLDGIIKFALSVSIFISVVFTALTFNRNIIWENSETLWVDVISKSPTNPRGYNGLGYAYYNAGRYEEALPLFKKSVEIKPDYADVYNNMGITYFKLPDMLDEAIVNLEKAIKLNSIHSRAMNNLGVALSKKGDYEKAKEWLFKAYNLDNKYGRPHYNIGNIYTKTNETATAIEYYKKSIEIDPEYERPYFNMSVALGMEKRYDEAIESLHIALKIKPDYVQAHHNLGAMYFRKEMYPEAIQSFQNTLKLNPNYSDSYYNMAVVYNKMGDFKEAERMAEKTLALNPKHRRAINMLNDLQRDAGPN